MIAKSQAPAIQWQKCFGGSQGDYGKAIKQTLDGGYIMAGYTLSNDANVSGNHATTGYEDFWVVKMSNSGTMQWQKCLGGSDRDQANVIELTLDGGYLIGGYAQSTDGDLTGIPYSHSTWLTKIDSIGTVKWSRRYTINNEITSIFPTIDTGFIITVQSYVSTPLDFGIIKIDRTGAVQWQRNYGGTNQDLCKSIVQTIDGGFIAAGASNSNNGYVNNNHGNYDGWVVKLNNVGDTQWTKCYGGLDVDMIYSIVQTPDLGYIMTGYTLSNDADVTGNQGGSDYWIIKIDSVGTIQWQKTCGGTYDDQARSIALTVDGGYIVSGYSYSNDGDVTGHHGSTSFQDAWVVKLSNTGIIQWQKSLGGTNNEGFGEISQTPDLGYICGGTTFSNNGDISGSHGGGEFWAVKLTSDPLPIKLTNYTLQLKENNNVINQWITGIELNTSHFNIQRSIDGKTFETVGMLAAKGFGSYTFTDPLTTKHLSLTIYYRLQIVDKDGSKTYSETKKIRVNELTNKPINVFPNPAKDIVTIEAANAKEILITDDLGRTVKQIITPTEHQVVDIKQLSKGIYTIKIIKKDGGVSIQKLVKE